MVAIQQWLALDCIVAALDADGNVQKPCQ